MNKHCNNRKMRKEELNMKKVLIIIMIIAILSIGAVSFASGFNRDNIDKDNYSRMIDLAKENGFSEVAKAIEDRDFDSMDDFMNNMYEEDYEKMIDIMSNNGHKGMANRMKLIGREKMIEMHNSMGGAQACHNNR